MMCKSLDFLQSTVVTCAPPFVCTYMYAYHAVYTHTTQYHTYCMHDVFVDLVGSTFSVSQQNTGITEATPLAYNPDAPSGHFQRHLEKKLGVFFGKGAFYKLNMPANRRSQFSQVVHPLTVHVPHEQLTADLAENIGTTLIKLREAIDNNDFPPSYYTHPIVTSAAAGELVLPIALYVDGVPYSHTDGVVGFWIVDVLTSKRYLFAVLRKSILCRCGCRGWCSFHALFVFCNWTLTACATGVMPVDRHDYAAWGPMDSDRANASGELLAIKCAMLWVKGDWAEFCTTFGLPTWQDGLRPCFECSTTLEGLDTIEGAGPIDWPHRLNVEGDFEAACTACEVPVICDLGLRDTLLELLAPDNTPAGARGMAMLEDLPSVGLRKSDRLEPSITCSGILELSAMTQFPVPIMFWRRSAETLMRHRNPLINIALGVTICRTFTVDSLHCLYLGPMMLWCRYVLWQLLLSRLWGQGNNLSEVVAISAAVLKNKLLAWYKVYRRANPTRNLTELSDMTVKMLGTAAEHKLKTKGAETFGLLLFLVDTLREQHGRINLGQEMLEAGQCLVDLVGVWDACDMHMPAASIQQCFDLTLRHLSLTESVEELLIPKRHLLLHLLKRMGHHGNPRFYATWFDESLNKLLKRSCKHVSQATFESSVLTTMSAVLKGAAVNELKRKRE